MASNAADQTEFPARNPNHGGARPGAGRPRSDKPAAQVYQDLAEAKAKHEHFKAQKAELEYKQRAGKLLPIEEVVEAWTTHIGIAKNRLMSIPTRLAPELVAMTEMRKIEDRIREEIHAALEQLSKYEPPSDL